jgi:dTDP-4-dehydrorhamnose reductase
MTNGIKDDLRKVLVVGGHGAVGQHVPWGTKPPHAELDILRPFSIARAVKRYRPTVILDLAAMTDFRQCENNPQKAYEVNVVGTYNLAKAAETFGLGMVYVSSGAVFGGRGVHYEDAVPDPVNVYGRTKYAGEFAVRDMVSRSLIARTGWLFGAGPGWEKKFVNRAITALACGKKVYATSGRKGSFTHVDDFVACLAKYVLRKRWTDPIVHVANGGAATYYEAAAAIARQLGVPPGLVQREASDNLDAVLRPPSETVGSRIVRLRNWRVALGEYVASQRSRVRLP